MKLFWLYVTLNLNVVEIPLAIWKWVFKKSVLLQPLYKKEFEILINTQLNDYSFEPGYSIWKTDIVSGCKYEVHSR